MGVRDLCWAVRVSDARSPSTHVIDNPPTISADLAARVRQLVKGVVHALLDDLVLDRDDQVHKDCGEESGG